MLTEKAYFKFVLQQFNKSEYPTYQAENENPEISSTITKPHISSSFTRSIRKTVQTTDFSIKI